MSLDPFIACGIVGAACYVAAYFANLRGWLVSSGWAFPAANLFGALLILVSLFDAWNLPSVVLEVFWAMISVYGLVRSRGG
ncbi:MAG: hypothetical protein P4L90_13865 [Rhodopila sp.]|nr:hypothetical protein [Rhodopila sp.]